MLPQKCYLANHNQEIVRLVFRKCWRLQVIDVIKGARGPDFGHARWVFLCVVFRDINNPIQTIHNSSDSDSQKQANILSRIYTKTTKIWKMIAVVLAFLIILHKQSHLKWCIVFIFIFFLINEATLLYKPDLNIVNMQVLLLKRLPQRRSSWLH